MLIKRLKRSTEVQIVLVDQALVSGTNFLSGVILARALGPDQFGVFTLAWTGILFAISLHFSAITAPMMSIGPKEQDSQPLYYSKVFTQHVLISSLLVVLTAVAASLSDSYFEQRNLESFVLVLPAIVGAFTTQEFLRRLCFTQHRPQRALISDLLRYGLQLILLLAIWQRDGSNLDQMLWVIALCGLLGCFPLFGLGLRFIHDSVHWVRHIHFSKWMIGGSMVQWFSGNLFLIATGALIGASAAGAFRAAQQLTGPLQVLMQGLDNLIPVRLAEALQRGDHSGLRKQANQLVVMTALASAPVIALLVTIPEPIMLFFFGHSYQPYAYLVPWFAAATGLMTLATAWRGGLRALESTRPFFTVYAVSAVLCLLTAETIVRSYGLMGAVLGVVGLTCLQQGYFGLLFYLQTRTTPHNKQ